MIQGRDLTKLAGILGLLASNHDGERAAAGLLATRFLKERGWSWSDVLRPPGLRSPSSHRPVQPASNSDAKADLALAGRHFGHLNPWETAFVLGLSQRHNPLTPGQARKLGEITGRLRQAGCS